MAYNYAPPPVDIPDDGPGFGGPGFGFPGFGKSFNLDVGAGFPGFGGFGGVPGWGGAPYVPVTPLGGLWGFKGDLIVPMVVIGVAIFILILIVLAVKYALAFKLDLLNDLGGIKGGKLFRREAGTAPAEHLENDNLNQLANIVSAAVYSEGCSRRILCEMGTFAREGKQYTSLLRLMELAIPADYQGSFQVMTEAAEGSFECADKYPCGGENIKTQESDKDNEIGDDINPKLANQNNQTSPAALNQTTPADQANSSTATTPAPAQALFGKFKRAFLK